MLLNSMTSELDCMRTHLLTGFLEVAQYNINRESKDIKFYEFGNIYFNSQSYAQAKVLGILISGNHQAPTWLQPKGDSSSYFHIKSAVESILSRFLDNLKFEDLDISFFNYGAKITYKKNEIGQLGEVSNEMKKSFDIKQDLFFRVWLLGCCLTGHIYFVGLSTNLACDRSLKRSGLPYT